MSSPRLSLVLMSAGVFSVVLAAPLARSLFVNGKAYPQPVLSQNGETYVSTAALKAAGAEVTVTESRVSIQFKPMRDQLQTNAVEGVREEWVQNEAWRVRVSAVQTIPSPFGRGPGAQLTLEMRNLVSKANSPDGSGLDKIQVLDEKGTVLSFQPASFKDQFTSLSMGAGFSNVLKFGDPTNALTAFGTPSKCLILFRNSGGKKLKDLRIALD